MGVDRIASHSEEQWRTVVAEGAVVKVELLR